MTAALIYGALGGWLLLACLVAPRIGRLLARAEQIGPRRIPVYPPPVPPPATRPEPDTDWLGFWPVQPAGNPETDVRFWQTVAAEDWSKTDGAA